MDQIWTISEVTKAVMCGDLSKQVSVDVQGEMLDLKMTVNSVITDCAVDHPGERSDTCSESKDQYAGHLFPRYGECGR